MRERGGEGERERGNILRLESLGHSHRRRGRRGVKFSRKGCFLLEGFEGCRVFIQASIAADPWRIYPRSVGHVRLRLSRGQGAEHIMNVFGGAHRKVSRLSLWNWPARQTPASLSVSRFPGVCPARSGARLTIFAVALCAGAKNLVHPLSKGKMPLYGGGNMETL